MKFIKDNENLINVAVSRAKDYFFTFGERSIAGGGDTSDNAAQLLLDYTCSEITQEAGRRQDLISIGNFCILS